MCVCVVVLGLCSLQQKLVRSMLRSGDFGIGDFRVPFKPSFRVVWGC